MCADGGALSDAALQQLEGAAYSGAVRLEGGYAGWSEVRSPWGPVESWFAFQIAEL
jgi:rhodanese-related sulfurtransferase